MSKFTLVWQTENGGKTVYLFNTKAEKKAAVKILKGRGGCPVVPASTLNAVERNVEVAPQQTTDEAVAKQPQGISAEELQSLADFFRNPGLVRARKEAESEAIAQAKAEEEALYQEVKVQVRKDLAQELLEKQFNEGKLEWQQLIDLYCFLERIPSVRRFISLTAWQTKSVSNYKELGAKSPKLSKVLMHLGLSAKAVSAILSADSKKSVEGSGSWITSSEEDIWDQGNSVHYKSCQATDTRSSWGGGSSFRRIEGDLEFAEKGELFLWVLGSPMRKDGKGFEARAKVRKVYQDSECSKLAGLYVDRPYGQHSKLMACLHELKAWWASEGYGTPIFFAPVWNRNDGESRDFEGQYGGVNNPLYCPSACGGYQDTLTRKVGPYTFMRAVSNENGTVRSAYSSRVKVAGVYLSESNQTWYNPQSRKFTNPMVSLPTERMWDSNHKRLLNLYQELGFKVEGYAKGVDEVTIEVSHQGTKCHWARVGSDYTYDLREIGTHRPLYSYDTRTGVLESKIKSDFPKFTDTAIEVEPYIIDEEGYKANLIFVKDGVIISLANCPLDPHNEGRGYIAGEHKGYVYYWQNGEYSLAKSYSIPPEGLVEVYDDEDYDDDDDID